LGVLISGVRIFYANGSEGQEIGGRNWSDFTFHAISIVGSSDSSAAGGPSNSAIKIPAKTNTAPAKTMQQISAKHELCSFHIRKT
jgi:hypothetical protein